ncbi:MAG: hypothetical protein JEZ14_20270 [Marinilabiliaceae bacterium]|nr:hypothetical protein [Marinilabiliaceae bacterium]
MIERDYILRIIQDLVKFIARMLKLLQEEDIEKAYDQVVRKTEKLTAIQYDSFLKMSRDDLKAKLSEKEMNAEYLDTLARFFMVSGEICIEKEVRDEAQHFLSCADLCMALSEEKFKTFSFERQMDQKKVREMLTQMGAN